MYHSRLFLYLKLCCSTVTIKQGKIDILVLTLPHSRGPLHADLTRPGAAGSLLPSTSQPGPGPQRVWCQCGQHGHPAPCGLPAGAVRTARRPAAVRRTVSPHSACCLAAPTYVIFHPLTSSMSLSSQGRKRRLRHRKATAGCQQALKCHTHCPGEFSHVPRP